MGWYPWDNALGDCLYAIVVYLLVVLITRRRAFPDVFSTAILFCIGIELFKLTGIPLLLRRYLVARWVLGTTFSFFNLAYYSLGIFVIAIIDRGYLRRRSSR